ncbi:MAG TPA: YbhB/YbcL family Raf kinase inhibitor-like protein [Planctomycetes bacterium]|nr:YbhB/YbcL family Raf kinase inhibitor-like protein [Planctomycetota bacterium]
MLQRTVILLLSALCLSGCERQKSVEETKEKGQEMEQIEVTSPAFEEGAMIPAEYTADGRDVSPPIVWSSGPEGTKSYVLINDDPDAPMGTWVHWVVYNIPADVTSLDENVPSDKTLPSGAQQGSTDFGRIGYGGPAPPGGTHRYFFKVYALDTVLDDLPTGATKGQVEAAMNGHVLAEGQLMGKYSRS